tara:strand:- start:48242 stop:48625 length:384 start_codon:yes stop_codon:yes gene_type:complete
MRSILVILLAFLLAPPVYSQVGDNENTVVSKGPRKQLATVIYAGLGGAVLGLSTLSFRGRPQDHLDSIAGGFAVGIIIGAIYSSYAVTKDPGRLQGSHYYLPNMDEDLTGKYKITKQSPWLQYTWTF